MLVLWRVLAHRNFEACGDANPKNNARYAPARLLRSTLPSDDDLHRYTAPQPKAEGGKRKSDAYESSRLHDVMH
jgi:hypothetical protein